MQTPFDDETRQGLPKRPEHCPTLHICSKWHEIASYRHNMMQYQYKYIKYENICDYNIYIYIQCE